METRIKERLTGALILVALLVIVVPELLSGHSPRSAADAVPAARPASEGPPLVTYRMPFDGAADSMPGQAALNVQPTQSSDHLPAPAPTAVEPPPAAAPAAPAEPAAAPLATPPVTQTKETPPPVPVVAPDKKSDAKPVAKPIAKPVAEEKKGWFVQLGVFSKHENAEQMVKQAGKKGHSAQITGSGSSWRVRVGPLSDRSAALAARKRLAADGLAGNLVAP